jgi:hypothetical protein
MTFFAFNLILSFASFYRHDDADRIAVQVSVCASKHACGRRILRLLFRATVRLSPVSLSPLRMAMVPVGQVEPRGQADPRIVCSSLSPAASCFMCSFGRLLSCPAGLLFQAELARHFGLRTYRPACRAVTCQYCHAGGKCVGIIRQPWRCSRIRSTKYFHRVLAAGRLRSSSALYSQSYSLFP